MNDLSFKRIFIAIAFLASFAFFPGCKDDDSPSTPMETETTIAAISDPHSYDLALGHSGADWLKYLAQDSKLLDENEAIFNSFIEEMKNNSTIKIVLITGDLTKDGEAASHDKFAKSLREIEKTGKKVYVLPGNHDVSNPNSRSYLSDVSTPTPNISPDQFANLYAEFGYAESIARDPNSLSYVAEPVAGLWLIAIDAAKYYENTKDTIVHCGKIKTETLSWVKQQLAAAKTQGKKVIGMMHHGMIEHFTGQKTNPVTAEYVIDDWSTVAPQLADAGLGLIFTGHFHANDVTAIASGNNKLYDVETASLIGYPSSYRVATLAKEGLVNIETKPISSINYAIPDGLTFTAYSEKAIRDGMTGLSEYLLVAKFGVPQAQAHELAPYVGDAFIRHYKGDESIPPSTQFVIDQLNSNAATQPLGGALQSMLTDLAPADNTVSFTIPVNKK